MWGRLASGCFESAGSKILVQFRGWIPLPKPLHSSENGRLVTGAWQGTARMQAYPVTELPFTAFVGQQFETGVRNRPAYCKNRTSDPSPAAT
jgi:hypothetical protein